MSTLPSTPVEKKTALWHNESGLIVCSVGRGLPALVAEKDSHGPACLTRPRLLNDDQIYFAFYPRRRIQYGILFNVLDLSNEDILDAIEMSDTRPPTYCLDRAIQEKWASLENLLIEISRNLLERHSKFQHFPPLIPPRLPHEHGYRHDHRDKDFAFRCARRSRDAFAMLSAFCTFSLSLWLPYEEDQCFNKAWDMLSTLAKDPIRLSTLQLLKESIVCDFGYSLRPGAFLSPYTTRWGPFIYLFLRAGVPTWLLWGHEEDYLHAPTIEPDMRKYYLPPPSTIEDAKRTAAPFVHCLPPLRETYIPPILSDSDVVAAPVGVSSSSDVDMHGGPDDPDPSAAGDTFFAGSLDGPAPMDPRSIPIKEGSYQMPGETWDAFRQRMEHALDRAIRAAEEIGDDRTLRRLQDRQKSAEQGHLSSRSTVFIWEPADENPDFLLRTSLTKYDAKSSWKRYTCYQRFYWPHNDQWDFCDHLPPCPEGASAVDEYDSDDVDDGSDPRPLFVYDPTPSIQKPNDSFAEYGANAIMEDLVVAASIPATEEQITISSICFTDYIRYRHGYIVSTAATSYAYLYDGHDNYTLTEANAIQVFNRLGFKDVEYAFNLNERTAVIDFHNTAIGAAGSTPFNYIALPPCWDISAIPHPRTLIFPQTGIVVQRATAVEGQKNLLEYHLPGTQHDRTRMLPSPPCALYIMRPSTTSTDSASWFVATTDPTTVLMVIRLRWDSTLAIARGLLELGVPFRTVLEHENSKNVSVAVKMSRSGLGSRPANFEATKEDYAAYKVARDRYLTSSYGRALRTRGGIAGRLAAEVVPDDDVLNGPSIGDELVGMTADGSKLYVDDMVPDRVLDAVCGLYVVEGESQTRYPSWWPTQSDWRSMGYSGDHWTQDAERFYMDRLAKLERGLGGTMGYSKWRDIIKRYHQPMSRVFNGSRRLAETFIQARLAP